jgi:hypothetical protein
MKSFSFLLDIQSPRRPTVEQLQRAMAVLQEDAGIEITGAWCGPKEPLVPGDVQRVMPEGRPIC